MHAGFNFRPVSAYRYQYWTLGAVHHTSTGYVAAQLGHVGAIKVLVSLGADPNIATNIGSTPVYLAARFGRHADAIKSETHRRSSSLI